MTIKVILDTNIPLLLAKKNFHLETEIERLIPQNHSLIFLTASIKELEFLEKKKKKKSREIALAKLIAEKFQIIEFNPENIKFADDKILQFAKNNKPDSVLVTNDKELKKKAQDSGVPVIFIRSKSHLELIGTIK